VSDQRAQGRTPANHPIPSPQPPSGSTADEDSSRPVLQARGLVRTYGKVVALDHADFELMPREVLGVIGDNGAGKSTLIKCLSGAETPTRGQILLEGTPVHFGSPMEARAAGIETVYQNLAVCPALDIASNLYLGREIRRAGILGTLLRMLDHGAMRRESERLLTDLGLLTIQNMRQAVETLSGGQRQGVAVARAAAFGSRVLIMDEPTAALGVREGGRVLQLIRDVRDRGLPVILISHDIPHLFEVADRVHIMRLGKRVAVISPKVHSMTDAVAIMTGAVRPEEIGAGAPPPA